MRSRFIQFKDYLGKFFEAFFITKSWKAFIFAVIISGVISWVVGGSMFIENKYTDTSSGLFSLISACIWIGIFNSIQEICKERDVIKRDYRSGLHISSYVLARAFYELIICFFQAVIITVISKLFLNLPEGSAVLNNCVIDFFITYFLVLLCSDYLGIAISCIVKSTTTAMTVMPFVLIIQLLLSGVLFMLEGGAKIVAKFTISKWGMRALGTASDIFSLHNNSLLPSYEYAEEEYLYTASRVLGSWGMLVLFCVIYLFIGILFLKRVDKDKR